jgi:hypothetical protein
MTDSPPIRQAVVIIHGMGEQRPLETLNTFIRVALPGSDSVLYSRPDTVTQSFESRRYLAPRSPIEGPEVYAQTEFYEYHWAHLMQGNRIGDLIPTFRRILFRLPHKVPAGLRFLWVLFWGLVGWVVWATGWGPLSDIGWQGLLADPLRVILGGGLIGVALGFLVSRLLPQWLTSSFVDVIRYLDTSPRSFEVRRAIRKGIVDLLAGLQTGPRYQRIVVVAHSLGTYIAYDAMSHLWAQMNTRYSKRPVGDGKPEGLDELEDAASSLASDNEAFRRAQRGLWSGIRRQGSSWLITDFVSLGSPMYFADILYTRNRRVFDERVKFREMPTCPPQPETGLNNNLRKTSLWFSYPWRGRRLLYHGAPFAVVRWTNIWFPARWGIFGDWFGGPLAPLFGKGISDRPVPCKSKWSWVPGYPHALYLKPRTQDDPVIRELQAAMDLASTSWVQDSFPVKSEDSPADD